MNRKQRLDKASEFHSQLKAAGVGDADLRCIASCLYNIARGKRKSTAPEPSRQESPPAAGVPPADSDRLEMHYQAFLINEDVPAYHSRCIAGSHDTSLLKKALAGRLNTLLIGETGTGKTHAIKTVAKEARLPYIRVNLDSMVTVEDLIGEYKPDGKGGFVWQDGVLLRFVKHGGIFVADEINAAPADILFVLHSLLDDDRQVVMRQKDGSVVKAHKDFWFVSTMNPDYEGTKPLNQALQDRFHVVFNYDYDKRVEGTLIKDKSLLEFAEKVRKMYMKGELSTPCSTRLLLQYTRNVGIFTESVAREILLNRFDFNDKAAVREAFEMHVDKSDDKADEEDDKDDEEKD